MQQLPLSPLYICIDVQAAATGPRCIDRVPIRVQAVQLTRDERTNELEPQAKQFNAFVSSVNSADPHHIRWQSLLTPITGITHDDYKHGMKQPLDQVVARLSKYVKPEAVIVSQADFSRMGPVLQQLGLTQGINYTDFVSLGELYNTDVLEDPKHKGQTFAFRTLVKVILNRDPDISNRAQDVAMLFEHYYSNRENPEQIKEWMRQCLDFFQDQQKKDIRSFAATHYEYEGVCLGHATKTPIGKSCACGSRLKDSLVPLFWL
jgi:hypothetical protein